MLEADRQTCHSSRQTECHFKSIGHRVVTREAKIIGGMDQRIVYRWIDVGTRTRISQSGPRVSGSNGKIQIQVVRTVRGSVEFINIGNCVIVIGYGTGPCIAVRRLEWHFTGIRWGKLNGSRSDVETLAMRDRGKVTLCRGTRELELIFKLTRTSESSQILSILDTHKIWKSHFVCIILYTLILNSCLFERKKPSSTCKTYVTHPGTRHSIHPPWFPGSTACNRTLYPVYLSPQMSIRLSEEHKQRRTTRNASLRRPFACQLFIQIPSALPW